jgi:hypothetical protein
MWAGCGFWHEYGYFVDICVRHFQNRKIMRIRVCVSRVIFKTGKRHTKMGVGVDVGVGVVWLVWVFVTFSSF